MIVPDDRACKGYVEAAMGDLSHFAVTADRLATAYRGGSFSGVLWLTNDKRIILTERRQNFSDLGCAAFHGNLMLYKTLQD